MYTEPETPYAMPHPGGREFAEDGSIIVRQGSRIASKQLLAVVAHDMRNYLTPMRGRAALLLRRALSEHREADVRDAAALERAIKRLNLLVINVLEGARLDAGLFTVRRRKVDLVDLAQDCAMLLATETVEVRVETPTRSLAALVDPEATFSLRGEVFFQELSGPSDGPLECLPLVAVERGDVHASHTCLSAASFFTAPEAIEVALISADQPSDPYLDFVRGETLKALEPHVKKATASLEAKMQNAANHRKVANALGGKA